VRGDRVCPRYGPLIRHELEAFEFQYTRTGVRYAAPEGLTDDAVCALALAVRARTTAAADDRVGVWFADPPCRW
jgi:hypothetical protein